jgi:uncharacterized protein (TIGR03083 family)
VIRSAFLEASQLAIDLIASDPVAERWTEPSALPGYDIAGLSGHLGRGLGTPLIYLAEPIPAEENVITPGQYFASVDSDDDALHASIRARGSAASAGGQGGLVAELDRTLGTLTTRLDDEPFDRRVPVFGGHVMYLDEYLVTRLVELLVHGDDLTVSVGAGPLEWPGEAMDLVLATLVEAAAIRHGSSALITALSRRERVTDWPTAI